MDIRVFVREIAHLLLKAVLGINAYPHLRDIAELRRVALGEAYQLALPLGIIGRADDDIAVRAEEEADDIVDIDTNYLTCVNGDLIKIEYIKDTKLVKIIDYVEKFSFVERGPMMVRLEDME